MDEKSPKLLTGKLAVVTGGGGGIGQAICFVFAREGATVVVADLNQDASHQTILLLPGSNNHVALPVDISAASSVEQLFEAIRQKYNKSPEVIVNCAGIIKMGPFVTATERDFDQVMNVNLKGTFLMTQAALRGMLADEVTNGTIVNIASVSAVRALKNFSIYAASKAGVIALTKTVATEMADKGVRCNAVLPGSVHTAELERIAPPGGMEMAKSVIPMKRLARPDEIAEMCAFLASEKSSYITGAEIAISGGF